MKYCEYCAAQLDDESVYCYKCGNKCASEISYESENDYSEYWGLCYSNDELDQIIRLEPNGVRICRAGFFGFKNRETFIPYWNIIDVIIKRPNLLQTGYISVITPTGGIFIQNDSDNQNVDTRDPNTVFFKRKNAQEIEPIYFALRDIINFPPPKFEDDFYAIENPLKPPMTGVLMRWTAIIMMIVLVVFAKSNL